MLPPTNPVLSICTGVNKMKSTRGPPTSQPFFFTPTHGRSFGCGFSKVPLFQRPDAGNGLNPSWQEKGQACPLWPILERRGSGAKYRLNTNEKNSNTTVGDLGIIRAKRIKAWNQQITIASFAGLVMCQRRIGH